MLKAQNAALFLSCIRAQLTPFDFGREGGERKIKEKVSERERGIWEDRLLHN